MSEVIWKLREDHKKLARLLDLLARETRVFDAGERPDYELVDIILEYIINYPDLFHHPIEDMVMAKLRQRDPDAADSVGNLEVEHEKLGGLTRRFAAAVHNIMQDEQLPRDWFVDVASEYLSFQRRHMQMEEVLFFPAALRALGKSDWDEILDVLSTPYDPLFDEGKARDKYERLHQEILKWGKLVDTRSMSEPAA